MRIVILQYGDYGEAYRRLQAGGPETFRDQRHSVDYVAALVPGHQVTTIAVCDRHHDEELASGLRSVGIPPDLPWDRRRLRPLLDRFAPEALVCRAPFRVAIAWAAAKRVPTLPVFADTFTDRRWRDRLDNWRHAWALHRCPKPCVSNHTLNASESLRRLGFSPGQIVPWEFRRIRPFGEAKEPPPAGRPFRLFFAGSLIESKGVGDCIEAVAIARTAHRPVELTAVGPGGVERWAALARRLGVEAFVRLPGVISAEAVRTEMRDHDAVLVPSRRDYAEGLPNTLYEALASRSPLIVSDHPAFAGRLRPSMDSLVFRAGQPRDLAEQIGRLIQEPGLYARLSRESGEALAGLYIGIEWSELMDRFIGDPLNAGGWTEGLTLAAYYHRKAAESGTGGPVP